VGTRERTSTLGLFALTGRQKGKKGTNNGQQDGKVGCGSALGGE
jgi:hypothetical protein